MTERIEELTPEQIEQMPAYVDKWLAIGLATSSNPLDMPEIEKAVVKSYKAVDAEAPAMVVQVGSPIAIFYAVALKEKLDAEGKTFTRDMVEGKTIEEMGVTEEEVKSHSSQVWEAIVYGAHSAYWLSRFDYFHEVVEIDCSRLHGLMDMAKMCGWWASFDEMALVSPLPTLLLRDEDNELHCEDGPALKFPDGWALYAVHGVRIPGWIIENPETITVDKIKAEENAEIRRIMRERFGEGKYLIAIKAKVIHTDTVATDVFAPKSTEITRALIEDDGGVRYLVGTDGSTRRTYYMQVPSEITTCSDAHNSLMLEGMDEKDCILQS